MLRRLYDWTMALSARKAASTWLAVIAFVESSVFLVPADVLFLPMALARPQRAWFYAAICTVASVLGGMLGYAIGALLYDTLGQWLISVYHYADKMEAMRDAYARWGWLLILIKGLTPIPYKLVTIVSGLLGYNFALFVLLSVVTRGARFFILAGLLNRFGDPIRGALERHFAAIVIGFVLLVAVGFYVATHAI